MPNPDLPGPEYLKLGYQFVTFLTGDNPDYLGYLTDIGKMGRGKDEEQFDVTKGLVVDDKAKKLLDENFIEIPRTGAGSVLNFYSHRQITLTQHLEEVGIKIINVRELFDIYGNALFKHFRKYGQRREEAKLAAEQKRQEVEQMYGLLDYVFEGVKIFPESLKTDFLKAISSICGIAKREDGRDQNPIILTFDIDVAHSGKVDFLALSTLFAATNLAYPYVLSFASGDFERYAKDHPGEATDLMLGKYKRGKQLECFANPKDAIALYLPEQDPDVHVSRSSEVLLNRALTHPAFADIAVFHKRVIVEEFKKVFDIAVKKLEENGLENFDLTLFVDSMVAVLYSQYQEEESLKSANRGLKDFNSKNPGLVTQKYYNQNIGFFLGLDKTGFPVEIAGVAGKSLIRKWQENLSPEEKKDHLPNPFLPNCGVVGLRNPQDRLEHYNKFVEANQGKEQPKEAMAASSGVLVPAAALVTAGVVFRRLFKLAREEGKQQ